MLYDMSKQQIQRGEYCNAPLLIINFPYHTTSYKLYSFSIVSKQNSFQMVNLDNFRALSNAVLKPFSIWVPNTLYEIPCHKKSVHHMTNNPTATLQDTGVRVGICLARARQRQYSYLVTVIAAVTLLCDAGISQLYRTFNGGLFNLPLQLWHEGVITHQCVVWM